MNEAFKIAPGRYTIPNIGFVDTNKEISDELAFMLYRVSRRVFPWANLGPGAEAFLKKQRLKAKEVVALVHNAKTVEEIELLAKLSEAKAVARIVDVRIQALKNNNN